MTELDKTFDILRRVDLRTMCGIILENMNCVDCIGPDGLPTPMAKTLKEYHWTLEEFFKEIENERFRQNF